MERIALASTRQITFKFRRPGSDSKGFEEFTLWPDKPNPVPLDLFGFLLAQTDSQGSSPMQRYIDSKMVYEIDKPTAIAILQGAGKLQHPDPSAGAPKVVPQLADIPRSETIRNVERAFAESDPAKDSVDMILPPTG